MSGRCQYGHMGRVLVFSIAGLDLWFNSADHKPPHFHAEKSGEWELRIYFLRDRSEMNEKKWGKDPREAELKKLLGAAEEHRAELLKEWEQKVHVKTRGPNR